MITTQRKTKATEISGVAVANTESIIEEEGGRRGEAKSSNTNRKIATQTENVYSDYSNSSISNNNNNSSSWLLFDQKIRLATEGLEPRFNNLLANKILRQNAFAISEFIIHTNTESNPSTHHKMC